MNKQGFTLIELLVVVLIIGILAAVALPQYTTAVEKARATEALSLMSAIAGAAERYRIQKDAWPDADAFNKLDVEIPLVSGSTGSTATYGGQNFHMHMGPIAGDDTTFVIAADRALENASKAYTLKTILVENSATGAFSTTRACTIYASGGSINTTTTAPSDSLDAGQFCNAISNGHPQSF